MSIAPYLNEFDADPETKRVLAVALEMTRVSLGLADDLADGIIAKRIVELARAGERHPDVLCEGIEGITRPFVRRLTKAVIQAPRCVALQMGRSGSALGGIRRSFARPKGAS